MKPLKATDVETLAKNSTYPEPFASRMLGRVKRKLGDAFGLSNFGVNLTTIAPGGESALMHVHTVQDEFIYVLEGVATLVLESGEHEMRAGDCMGFPANGEAHQIANRSDAPMTYLEIGDRLPGDSGSYPRDDLAVIATEGEWVYTRKDGTSY
jgi:uncharacterized cupin superfamily protein